MPACDIRCPIVRAELKKVVAQSPWIWHEQLASRIGADASGDLDRDDRTGERAAADRVLAKELIYKEGERGKGVREVSDSKPESSGVNGTRERRESATQSPRDAYSQSVEERGVDPLWSRTAVRTAETEMEPGIKKEKEVSTTSQFADRGTDDGLTEEELARRIDATRFDDECESTCPRRISRKSRIRKLEERQRIVDTYLLSKGTRYFDDVCTCSLSCIVRSLKQDPFVRSIIASVALFTFGLKLCTEFDAWYMPIRLS